MSVLRAGKAAPPFSLTATDGKSYSLQEALKKGPVLAAFFKVTCPTCQYTFPFLERLHQQLRANGAQIWGVAQDGMKDSQRFARDYAVTFPILMDDKPYRVSRAYGLEYVPTLFLIAPDGSSAYVAVSRDNYVAVVDLKTLAVTGRIETGKGPDGLAWAVRK